jgi:hypothetical protein
MSTEKMEKKRVAQFDNSLYPLCFLFSVYSVVKKRNHGEYRGQQGVH